MERQNRQNSLTEEPIISPSTTSSDMDTEEADAVHLRISGMQSKSNHRIFPVTEVDDSPKSNKKEKIRIPLVETPPPSGFHDHDRSSDKGEDIRVRVSFDSSTTPKHRIEEESFGFDVVFFRRFFRLHGLLFLGVTSLSTCLFLFLLSICLLQEYVVYQVGLIASGFYKVLAEKNFPGFLSQTYKAIGIILAIAFIRSTNQYIQKVLTVTWRQLLCKAVHRLYFSDIRYYQLNVLDKSIDNPDQRITQDIDKFCSTYCEILPKLLISPFVISYYCYQAYQRSGWQGPLGCFGFFVIATVINKLIMTPIVRFVVKQEKCEGDFRFIHMLLRVNSESVAFHNASSVEAGKANESLDRLLKVQHKLYFRQFFLSFSVNLFDYFGAIFSYLMLAIPIFFSDKYDNLTPADLSVVISQNAFVLMYLISTFSSLVDTSGRFTDIAGVVHRISQLIEKLNALGDFWNDLFPEDNEKRSASSLELYDEWKRRRDNANNDRCNGNTHSRLLPAWILKNVTFSAPMSTEPLISNLTLSFSAGESVLIVGHSSAGKSSLLRLLRGLWPQSEGTIKRYYPPGPQGVFYCPQKSYLTFGTLRDQITFPLKSLVSNSQEDNLIIHYLTLLRLKSLIERTEGLDVPVSWNLYDTLSPGEMQRLCFIRVFFHRPLLAILDEATSALPLEMEHLVYSECQRLGITTISVGHRASLKEYHDKLLTLTSKGGWTLEPIIPSKTRSMDLVS